MTVYVDRPFPTKRSAQWPYAKAVHMMADTDDELHAFARKLHLRRSWFQGDHYDITHARYRTALRLGAVQTTSRGLARLRQGRRGDTE